MTMAYFSNITQPDRGQGKGSCLDSLLPGNAPHLLLGAVVVWAEMWDGRHFESWRHFHFCFRWFRRESASRQQGWCMLRRAVTKGLGTSWPLQSFTGSPFKLFGNMLRLIFDIHTFIAHTPFNFLFLLALPPLQQYSWRNHGTGPYCVPSLHAHSV